MLQQRLCGVPKKTAASPSSSTRWGLHWYVLWWASGATCSGAVAAFVKTNNNASSSLLSKLQRQPKTGINSNNIHHWTFPFVGGANQRRRAMSTSSDAPNTHAKLDEVALARAAAAAQASMTITDATTTTDSITLFDKIVAGDIPCTKVYEDDLALAFRDISPAAPVHVLVIPKDRRGLTQLSQADIQNDNHALLLGHLLLVASQVGKSECPNGFRIVINDGVDGAQSVYHLHIHVLGGRQMQWPPG